jgi:hypothetical protein
MRRNNKEYLTMKTFLKISLASALVASSVAVSAPQAFANGRHHFHDDQMAMCGDDIVPLLFVGAALGAVTGGVGAAVAWGSAYAVGGAAVGGGTGLLLAHVHGHHHCG